MQLPPAAALHTIICRSAIQEKRAAGEASRELRVAAGLAIATLQALDGELPSRAWAAFSRADGLRVARVRILGRGIDVPSRVAELLAQLPRRVRRLCVEEQEAALSSAERVCAALAASAAVQLLD